ncbi:hypothetical protein Tco_1074374 [Tanacetum coccineum]
MIVSYSDKANVVSDALSRKKRVKSRRVRGMILAAQSEAFKQENVLAERLHGLDQRMERKGDKFVLYGSNLGSIGKTQSGDNRRKTLEFKVRDRVLLKVSPWKGVIHFGKKEYLADTNLHVHLEEIKVDKTLCFVEEPVEIIDCEVKSLKRSRIPIVKSIRTRSEVMRIS